MHMRTTVLPLTLNTINNENRHRPGGVHSVEINKGKNGIKRMSDSESERKSTYEVVIVGAIISTGRRLAAAQSRSEFARITAGGTRMRSARGGKRGWS